MKKNQVAQVQKRNVIHGNQCMEYTLTRKQVKNINLRIKVDGSVAVSANPRIPVSYIDQFVQSKADFILKAKDKIAKSQKPETPLQCVEGERIRYLGNDYILNIIKGKEDGVRLDNGHLFLVLKNPENQKQREKVFHHWMEKQQREVFEALCKKIYPLFQEVQPEFPEIKIRTMKSIWGSCHYKKGIITLNRRLIEKPIACIEYVVLHEFAHFVYPNHSKQFYGVIARYMPDYLERKKLLQNG